MSSLVKEVLIYYGEDTVFLTISRGGDARLYLLIFSCSALRIRCDCVQIFLVLGRPAHANENGL